MISPERSSIESTESSSLKQDYAEVENHFENNSSFPEVRMKKRRLNESRGALMDTRFTLTLDNYVSTYSLSLDILFRIDAEACFPQTSRWRFPRARFSDRWGVSDVQYMLSK